MAGRPTRQQMDIEAERLNMLHVQRKKMMKALNAPPSIKKGGFLPGEEARQKNLAIFLKLAEPRTSYTAIAGKIGETKTTVRKWFTEDPYVREQYEWLLHNLTEGALDFIRTMQIEAVATLATLMRFGSERYMLEAAKEILDRGGAMKVAKSEVSTTKTEVHSWDDSLVERIRSLPEDRQEEAAQMIEQIEAFLDEAEGVVDSSDEDTGDVINSDDDVDSSDSNA
jgi:predicted transcriptional regulator